ncbi:hypothetical protein [Streptococcus danieliae]|uniref:Uncharacterized protein n=1 Tax=Streptococcus danieliae TaxID=747656 RepID=A0A7Z0M856_9STRE|nr:hypothetical protein [Streptococcus danieliae]MBF0700317.1 hypothetical protein [Streptococcus danieliae]NYS97493.1 hypothetical protein [Streptococcus danieliae]
MILTDTDLQKIQGGGALSLIDLEHQRRRPKGEIRLPPPIKPKPEIM